MSRVDKKERDKSPRQRWVRRMRLSADLTGFELDSKAGFAPGTIGNIESTREPTDAHVRAIAQALDVEVPVDFATAKVANILTKEVDENLSTLLVYWGVVPQKGWTRPQGESMKSIAVPGQYDRERCRLVRIAGLDYAPRFVKGQLLVVEQDTTARSGVPLLIEHEGTLELGRVVDGSLQTYQGKEAADWAVLGFVIASREDDPAGLSW